MYNRKQYTFTQIAYVIRMMNQILKKEPGSALAKMFVRNHPWLSKYISVGFTEAEQLREAAGKSGFSIKPYTPTPMERALRRRFQSTNQIIYEARVVGRIFLFRFEETTCGAYIAISG